MVQAARGPRVPPRRAVQQPRPGRHPRLELRARAAGVDHRSALHADLGHGGRRRDVRNDALVVRPRSSALVFDGLPRHGQRRPRDRRNIDRWFCGSYRDYIPDHYELGYQICSYACDRYGEDVWDKVARYGSRNPYVLATTRVALGKFYDTNVIPLFRETFDVLERYWDSLPQDRRQRRAAHRAARKNHTTYQWPLPLGDTVVVALKTDSTAVSRFVRDRPPYGREEDGLSYGAGLDPPADGRRPRLVDRVPPFHAFRTARQLAIVLHGPRRRCAPHGRTAAQHALSHAVGRGVRVGRVQSRRPLYGRRAARRVRRTAFRTPVRSEIHGLAWDDRYAGLLRPRHGRQRHVDRPHRFGDGVHPLPRALTSPCSNLRAGGGKLYYGSIASGRDEAHCYDLKTRREYRITDVGLRIVHAGAVPRRRRGAVDAYDSRGYRVAEQRVAADADAADSRSRLRNCPSTS